MFRWVNWTRLVGYLWKTETLLMGIVSYHGVCRIIFKITAAAAATATASYPTTPRGKKKEKEKDIAAGNGIYPKEPSPLKIVLHISTGFAPE